MAIGEVKEGDRIAVWFSCGAASAVAAKTTLEVYGNYCPVTIVNNFIAEEDEDNRRFLHDVEKWLGVKIESAINPKYPSGSCVEVWSDRKYMSGIDGAPCTLELKKNARYAWEQANHIDWHVMGFTFDEWHRFERFRREERSNALPVLFDALFDKQDCFRIVSEAGIRLPKVYEHLPNANCIGCVKATSPTYWNTVRQYYPEQFRERAEQSRQIGAKLVRVKGKRIFLDELDPKAKGLPLKNMKPIECSIFCDV